MFNRTAAFYDAIYSFKDYERESQLLHELIQTRLPARSLVDVACGTGKHLEHLRKWYEAAGVDAQPEMVELARERLPELTIEVGDMRSFDLGREFDVVTCLFSSIGYMKTQDDFVQAVTNMAKHLRSGGLLLIEPWLSPQAFIDNSPHMLMVNEPELKIARACVSRREGRLSVMDMHYLIASPAGVETFVELHELLLLTPAEQVDLARQAGLVPEFVEGGPTGRGIILGTKQT